MIDRDFVKSSVDELLELKKKWEKQGAINERKKWLAKLEGLKYYMRESLKQKKTKIGLECSLEYVLRELEKEWDESK